MKDNKMGNIWQALIKCILHIFIEKSLSKFSSHFFKQDSGMGGGRLVPTNLIKFLKNWVTYIEAMSINGKNIHEIPEILFFFLTVIGI